MRSLALLLTLGVLGLSAPAHAETISVLLRSGLQTFVTGDAIEAKRFDVGGPPHAETTSGRPIANTVPQNVIGIQGWQVWANAAKPTLYARVHLYHFGKVLHLLDPTVVHFPPSWFVRDTGTSAAGHAGVTLPMVMFPAGLHHPMAPGNQLYFTLLCPVLKSGVSTICQANVVVHLTCAGVCQ